MFKKPVNSIDAQANTIKVNDNTSSLKMIFKDGNGQAIDMAGKIDYFRITKDKMGYYEVTDYTTEGDAVLFRLPDVPKGHYYVEVRDTNGQLYPADRDVVIEVRWSMHEGEQAYYTSYKESVLNDVEPIIVTHMTDNAELYKGDKGDPGPKGDPFEYEDFTAEQLENLRGPEGPEGPEAVLGEGDVKLENIGFINKSTNLFDKFRGMKNFTVDSSTGELRSEAGYFISDFINVSYGKHYSLKDVYRWVRYDEDKNFVDTTTSTTGALGISEGIEYVKIVVEMDKLDTAQMNEGDSVLPYEPYYNHFEGVYSTPENKSIDSNMVKDKVVELPHIAFIEDKSTNLFDKNSMLKNTRLEVSAGGTPARDENYNVSQFIPVKKGVKYSYANVTRIAFYDDNFVFVYSTNNTSDVSRVREDIGYVKLVVDQSNVDTAQMNEGGTLLPYEPYYDYSMTPEAAKAINKTKATDIRLNDFHVQGTEWRYKAGLQTDMSSAHPEKPLVEYITSDFHDLYDDLMLNHPTYITKRFLGNEPTGLPINLYEFKPFDVPTTDAETNNSIKVILTTGTHNERASLWVQYLMFKEIAENWRNDRVLEFLRWNVTFLVIPVVNPWGLDNGSRTNSNGVDINRNFPPAWREGAEGQTYGGTKPLSETESQIVDQLLRNNSNAIYYCDFHNFFEDVGNTQLFYNTAATSFNINIGKHFIRNMSAELKKDYSELPQADDVYFGFAERSPKGATARQGAHYGIQSSVFEVTNRFMSERSYGEIAMTVGLESYINWIYLVIRNNIELENKK